MRSRLAGFAKRSALVVFGIVFALLLLECALRIGGLAVKRTSSAKSNQQRVRIVCIGESTTAAWPAENPSAWTARLERYLNETNPPRPFEVINFGIVGATTDQLLHRFESEIDTINPDIVIAMMGVNDDGNVIVPHRRSTLFNTIERGSRALTLLGAVWRNYYAQSQMAHELGNSEFAGRLPSATRNSDQTFNELRLLSYLEAERAATDTDFGNWFHHYYNRPRDTIFGSNYEALLRALYRKRHPEHRSIVPLEDLKQWALSDLHEEISTTRDDENGFLLSSLLASLYELEGHRDLTVAVLEDAASRFSGATAYIYLRLASVYQNLGKRDLESSAIERVRSSWGDRASTLAILGNYFFDRGDYAKSLGFYQNALSIARQPNGVGLSEASRGRIAYNRFLVSHSTAEMRQGSDLELHAMTKTNYLRLHSLVRKRSKQLFAMQYPTRSIQPLRSLLGSDPDVVFVDNQQDFINAVEANGYFRVFNDNFAGSFGHFQEIAQELLARKLTTIILEHYKG